MVFDWDSVEWHFCKLLTSKIPINRRGISVIFHFKNQSGIFVKFWLRKSEGIFVNMIPKKFRKILEKSLNLEIENLTKYNSFFHEIFSIGSRI